jgi:TetR/AcrR family transcriptional regulator, tetracycline repressor protein
MSEKLSTLQRLAQAAKAHAEAERTRLEARAGEGDLRAINMLVRIRERDRRAHARRDEIRQRIQARMEMQQAAVARPRGRLQPSDVVAAALDLLDAKGLDAVTLRDLAAKLHVQAPALYWHFASKRDIVDAMAQAILVDHVAKVTPPADATAWRPWLRQMAHALRTAMLSRRDGGRIVAGAGLGRARALADIIALSLRTMEAAGFDPVTASAGTRTVLGYTFGAVIEEQSEPDVDTEAAEINELVTAYPDIARAIDAQLRLSPTAFFDMGLELILRGLETRK